MLASTIICLALAALATAQTTAAETTEGRYGVLRTLVSQSCLQQCYISVCSDIDPACVCATLAADEAAARACAERSCGGSAFAALRVECVARSAALGVVFGGEEDVGSASTTATAATARTSASTSTRAATRTEPAAATLAPSAATTGFAAPARPPALIAAAVVSPIVFLALVGAAALLLRWHHRQRLKRASINTFMDQSDPHSPQIGGPLDVRHEKLPDFLNDILRQPDTSSAPRVPGYENPETLGPPYRAPPTAAPPPVQKQTSTTTTTTAAATATTTAAPEAYTPPPLVGIPAYENPELVYPGYENPELVYPGYENPFRDPITTNHSHPAPLLLARGASLSAISERSSGGDPQAEMRPAYRALRREVGDDGGGGSQQQVPRRLV